MRKILSGSIALCLGSTLAPPVSAGVIYNNLTPNNLMAIASRPDTSAFEIESADDFIAGTPVTLTNASFTGLLVPPPTGGATAISQVVVELYRVFPHDSDTVRTPAVPTRMNSPSDVAFDARDSAAAELTFGSTVLNTSFTALNSVGPGGIHPSPGQNTGGNGPVTGQQVQIDVVFITPIDLPADHYFFIPQVELTNGGTFYWLSASRPISGAGTTPIAPDLQSWTRDEFLDPDWLRVGADIVGGATAPTFNAAFSLDGIATPEPVSFALAAAGLALLGIRYRRRA